MKPIGDFLARLSSRKFLLTVTGMFLVTMFPEAATEIVALITVFVGAEGAGDVVGRYAAGQTAIKEHDLKAQKLEFSDDDDFDTAVDKNTLIPGTTSTPNVPM